MKQAAKLTVEQTVWHWDKPAVSPEIAVAARKRRAFLQFCGMNFIACFIAHVSHASHLWLPAFICALSLVVLVGGYLVPPIFEAFEKFGKLLAKAVGTGLTYLLLVPFFFVCFVPARFILQAMGKDPLQREWNKDSKTYWADKAPQGDVERYKRQF